MPDEFRLTMTAALPDGIFDKAEVIAKLKPVVEDFQNAMENDGIKFELDFNIVTPKPRNKGEPESIVHVADVANVRPHRAA